MYVCVVVVLVAVAVMTWSEHYIDDQWTVGYTFVVMSFIRWIRCVRRTS